MAGMRDSPMDGTYSQDDLIMSRLNFQLARSRNILNSWTAQKPDAKNEDENDEPLDNDAEFENQGEQAGLGSKTANDEESALPTRRSAQKNKLLEQLIGKKAANAKRKEDAHKSMSASKHAAPKPITNGAKQKRQEEESDEEEEGRAAAFKSKKTGRLSVSAPLPDNGSDGADENVEQDGLTGQGTERSSMAMEETSPKPQKRKAGGSYLDELLSKKAKKKSKKKQAV